MKDPQLLVDAKRFGLDINPVAGDELQKLVGKLYGAPASVVRRAVEAMQDRP
jgi:hypothetical protein